MSTIKINTDCICVLDSYMQLIILGHYKEILPAQQPIKRAYCCTHIMKLFMLAFVEQEKAHEKQKLCFFREDYGVR